MKELSECIVLIVDDTEANVDILVDALAETYDIAVAMDGESALEAVADEKPDLILLDIMMPGMNGFEVCNEPTRDIPIIFLSGRTASSDKEKANALGAADYVTKPFDVPNIQERVKTILCNNGHKKI